MSPAHIHLLTPELIPLLLSLTSLLGFNALHIAASMFHFRCCEVLISYGGLVNSTTHGGLISF